MVIGAVAAATVRTQGTDVGRRPFRSQGAAVRGTPATRSAGAAIGQAPQASWTQVQTPLAHEQRIVQPPPLGYVHA